MTCCYLNSLYTFLPLPLINRWRNTPRDDSRIKILIHVWLCKCFMGKIKFSLTHWFEVKDAHSNANRTFVDITGHW